MTKVHDHHEAMDQLLKRSGEFSSSDDDSSSDDNSDDINLFNEDNLQGTGINKDPVGKENNGIKRRRQGDNSDEDSDDDFFSLSQTIQLDEINDTVKLYKDTQQLLKEVNNNSETLELPSLLKRVRNQDEEEEEELPVNESDELEDAQQEFRSKYPHLHIPYSDELAEVTEPYMDTVLSILDGTQGSQYYSRAKAVAQKSTKPFISVEEFRSLNLVEFTAGYFGLRRQLKLGTLIYERYKDLLLKSKSPRIQWWGAIDFSNYVLAPEVLASMVLDTCRGKRSLKIHEREDVYTLFDETAQYGQDITDKEPLESWEVKVKKAKKKKNRKKH